MPPHACPPTQPATRLPPAPLPYCSFGGIEETFIMGDVTFGACCIDDYSADALGGWAGWAGRGGGR